MQNKFWSRCLGVERDGMRVVRRRGRAVWAQNRQNSVASPGMNIPIWYQRHLLVPGTLSSKLLVSSGQD